MNQPSRDAFRIPRELIARYNVAGPRYTSYPTAPEWRDGLSVAQASLLIEQNQLSRADVPISLYVHIPFCHRLCWFCGCNMWVTSREELVARYLEAVCVEIERLAARLNPKREVVQIHWGGGTPTFLNSRQLVMLFEAIARHFRIRSDAEISLELHPSVTSHEQLDTLAQLGFNRVSMGIQDFDERVQAAINRPQGFDLTKRLIERCRELGFISVNTDLMYGLPYQSHEGFDTTLALIEQLRPDRIALFNYAHVPWLKAHMRMIKEDTLPSPDEKLGLFELAIDALLKQGYRYIGMDHFATSDNELSVAQINGTLRRNFMGYTTCSDSDLYAFGPSSISDLDRAYLQNHRNVNDYIRLVSEGDLAVVRGLELNEDDRLRRAVINDLFCLLRVDKVRIGQQFGIDFDGYFADALARLVPLRDDGLVTMDERHVSVTPQGQILLRNVAMAFDAYYHRCERAGSRFSKTV